MGWNTWRSAPPISSNKLTSLCLRFVGIVVVLAGIDGSTESNRGLVEHDTKVAVVVVSIELRVADAATAGVILEM